MRLFKLLLLLVIAATASADTPTDNQWIERPADYARNWGSVYRSAMTTVDTYLPAFRMDVATSGNIAVGEVVAVSSATELVEAYADSTATTDQQSVVGVATSTQAADALVMTHGETPAGTFTGLTTGTMYYLSDSTPGALTTVAPTTPDDQVAIGRATSATQIMLAIAEVNQFDGPASSTAGELALFDGASGKLLKGGSGITSVATGNLNELRTLYSPEDVPIYFIARDSDSSGAADQFVFRTDTTVDRWVVNANTFYPIASLTNSVGGPANGLFSVYAQNLVAPTAAAYLFVQSAEDAPIYLNAVDTDASGATDFIAFRTDNHVEQWRLTSTALHPTADNSEDIGLSGTEVKTAWVQTIDDSDGEVEVAANLLVAGRVITQTTAQTTDATPDSSMTYAISNGNVAHVLVTVVGRVSGGAPGDTGVYRWNARAENVAGTVSVFIPLLDYGNEDVSAWNATLVASGGSVAVQVTGAAATTIDWSATWEVIEL